MPINFTRHPENPIVIPGLYDWRMAVVFNPGVMYDEGRFYMYERAAGQLRPFHCYIGMLESDDGVHFRHAVDKPVFTPAMAGSEYGSVQDPRVVRIDGLYYMTYAFRPYAWNSHPTGVGVPESFEPSFPSFSGKREENMTRSGIAVSSDRVRWEHHSWPTPAELDDRDVILFPEKIDGRFALLRRPLQFVGTKYGTEHPGIWICFSEDLHKWSEPKLLIKPEFGWEDNRIGGSTPPIKTDKGWLVLYHGVENQDPRLRRVCYRLGAMMLGLNDPTRVIARTRDFIMEPETYYEKFGLYIPNVIFPTANVVKDGLLFLYYGVCDTAIALATVPIDELVNHVMQFPV
jgi:predicted GH43/DUF377 family glycosyl hydrolase